MPQGGKRDVLKQRDSEAGCTTLTLPSTLGGICNVSLQLQYPEQLHSFFMSKITCSAPTQLVSPHQADPLQTHKPKPTPALHCMRHKQVSSQPPPTVC